MQEEKQEKAGTVALGTWCGLAVPEFGGLTPQTQAICAMVKINY